MHGFGGTLHFPVAEVLAVFDHAGNFRGTIASQSGSLSLILRKKSREKICSTLSS